MWSKAVTVFIAMMLMVPWSSAQSTFGSIVGVVKDPSQSAVAGA
jgi:phosphate/sulfate permease